jgi:hypothetical protein
MKIILFIVYTSFILLAGYNGKNNEIESLESEIETLKYKQWIYEDCLDTARSTAREIRKSIYFGGEYGGWSEINRRIEQDSYEIENICL